LLSTSVPSMSKMTGRSAGRCSLISIMVTCSSSSSTPSSAAFAS
jgi:hypothetical protein